MNRCQFIEDHHRAWGVKRLCQVLEIARSSFYKWRAGRAARAAREQADAALAERIRAVHAEWDGTYGRPRITAELRGEGARVNHKRVGRVMRKYGIAGLRLRKRQVTTMPEPSATPVPDLLRRDFTASAPNTKYVGSGSRRELPPPAPTEPCVTVSHYTALVTLSTRSGGQTASGRTSLGIAV